MLAFWKISSYSLDMPRRHAGTVLPLELEILERGLAMKSADEFYGYSIAQALSEGGHGLTAHGTLYKALSRMVEAGLLTAEWETAIVDGRPRRRIYAVTGDGERVAREARAAQPQPAPSLKAATA
jgi:PadR family transcriptional regulator PadR